MSKTASEKPCSISLLLHLLGTLSILRKNYTSLKGHSSAVQARAVLVLGLKFPSFIIFLPEKIIEPPSNVQVMFQ